jgi:putative ABC transport system substrate-binding protein
LIVLVAMAMPFSCRKSSPHLYTIGILQLFESSTLVEARRGFVRALEDAGLRDGINIRIDIRDGGGDPVKLQEHARAFVAGRVDLIVPLSTQSLQAALIATSSIPIVFVSVANPYLTRAGVSSVDHLPNVTGVASTAPLRQALALIKDALPLARRIGTLWTPSEINSGYYLDIVRTEAADFGFEIVTIPVSGPSDILLAAQILTNQKIDAVLPISDNTINAKAGAAAAVGWDFFEMGMKAGRLAVRIKAGERPAKIPFENMTEVRMILNLPAAGLQGLLLPENLRRKADSILE